MQIYHSARTLILIAFLMVLTASAAISQTTEFNYQGTLKDGANPANGNYDLEFRLYSAVSAGTQIGSLIMQTVVVSNGAFNVQLDFGSVFPGADRYLEIRVKPTGPGLYTTLTPRQKVNSAPYTVKSLTAENANSLGGVAANQYIATTGGNFNIAGSGTVGGTLSGGIVNAATQFNIGGERVLSTAGSRNAIAGIESGAANTGSFNTFFGSAAGKANTTASSNSFFGALAGEFNTTGANNSFFGRSAGRLNGIGSFNSFFGSLSGDSNTSGERNSFFGRSSGGANSSGSDNSFFGYTAGLANSTGVGNAFFGAGAGAANTTADSNSFFGFNSGLVNSTGFNNAFFGSDSGGANTTGQTNTFLGVAAGKANTIASENTFVGTSAGFSNTEGSQNTFVGRSAGRLNIDGIRNTFVGYQAGLASTTFNNSFFGHESGRNTDSGPNNSFFGVAAGKGNTTGGLNAFFGSEAGMASNGNSNSFFGMESGGQNTSGSANTFVGKGAGFSNTTGDFNTALGTSASVGSGLSYATAIGAGATVTSSNRIVLGRPGVGTGTGPDRVIIPGTLVVENLFSGGSTDVCYLSGGLLGTCGSSIRYKTNINPFNAGLSLIDRLRPVSFTWKDGGKLDMGLVAEEVNAVEPLLTTPNSNGEVEGVKYDRIGVVLINAVKEQQSQIELLQQQLNERKLENEALKAFICSKEPDADLCKIQK